MSKPSSTKLGWLGPSPASSSHVQKVQSFIPADVEIIYEQLVLHDGRLADLEGKLKYLLSF